MAPPCFADLGKQTRDLFSKNYFIGIVKLDCKTKTSSGVNFALSGTSNNDTGKVNAHLETKYTVEDYGLTIKEKWTTNNILSTDLSVEDQGLKGLEVGAETNFAPTTGRKSGVLRAGFTNENVNLNADVNIDESGPVINGSGVFHYQGWLTGSNISFDVGQKKLTSTNVGLGYSQNDFVFHSNVLDGQEFAGYMYQKVNDKLQSGMQLNWTAGTNTTNFALGCIYKVDDDTSIRAKVNNQSQIGLSFTHKLRDGIQLSLSALIEGKSINEGGHKIGLGLNLEG